MIKLKTLLRSATALALLATAPATAQEAPATAGEIVVNGHAAIGDFGIDLTARDEPVKQGDDF
jgi:hypothetical protein